MPEIQLPSDGKQLNICSVHEAANASFEKNINNKQIPVIKLPIKNTFVK